jgi:hypothetical protein
MHNLFENNVEPQAMRVISLIFKLCTKKFLRLKRHAKIEDHFMLITLITKKAIDVCKDTLSLLIDKNIGQREYPLWQFIDLVVNKLHSA